MSVTTTCRDINELHKTAQAACRLFLSECEKAGVKIFITETYRSQARQNYLYEQGRTRPGKVVTWTRNSNHMGRLAWDIAVTPPVALYDVATLNKAGAIARKLGITWGGDWKNNIDRPHFEVKVDWKSPIKEEPKGDTKLTLQDIKPQATPNKGIGVVRVLENTVLRKEPIYTSEIIRELEKDEEYIVFELKNGWYNAGRSWIHSGSVFFLPTKQLEI